MFTKKQPNVNAQNGEKIITKLAQQIEYSLKFTKKYRTPKLKFRRQKPYQNKPAKGDVMVDNISKQLQNSIQRCFTTAEAFMLSKMTRSL